MKVYFFEGARGVGKSEIVRRLRDGMTNTVAMNFTGNNSDSQEGKEQTLKHYTNALTLFSHEDFDDSPFNYICDRFFFSEMVYSKLYKSYDFSEDFDFLLRRLDSIAKSSEIVVIHLTTSQKDLERNLNRGGKAHLFDNAKYADDVYKSLAQNAEYFRMFKEIRSKTQNIVYKTADLSNMTIEEAVEHVKSIM